MLEVLTYSKDDYVTVDRAEAETPEAAIVAARTLLQEAAENGVHLPRAAVYVDGRMVRCDVTTHEVSDAPQFDCDWAFRDPNSAANRA